MEKEINMNQTTLIVPVWASNSVHFLERNWMAIVGIILIALLSCIVTEFAKHKWSVKYEQDKAKTIVRWVLLAVSLGFTAIGTVIYFLQNNGMLFSKIPYIGENEVKVLGVAWALYNFRLNKTFTNIRAKASSWSGAKSQTSTVTPTPLPEEPSNQPAPTAFLG